MAYDTQLDMTGDTGFGNDNAPQNADDAGSTPTETAVEGNDPATDIDEGDNTDASETANEGDNADEGDTTDEGENTDEGDDAEKPQKPSRAQDRIRQLVDERKALEAKLAKYENEQNTADSNPDNGFTDDGGPDITQFDITTDEGIAEYLQACDEYSIEKAVNDRIAAREKEAEAEAKTQQLTADYQRAFERNPNFKENMADLMAWIEDKPVAADPSLVLQGDDLMGVIEEIAGNSDLYYRLAEMTETQQYAEYGKIHARLSVSKEAPTSAENNQGAQRVKSSAPKPPQHTKSNAPTKRNPYAVSDDDFLASRGL